MENKLTHEDVARKWLAREYPSFYEADSFPNRVVIELLSEGDKAYQKYYRLFHDARARLHAPAPQTKGDE